MIDSLNKNPFDTIKHRRVKLSQKEQGKSEGFGSRNRRNDFTLTWIQIVDFSARVTWKFDGWHRKTIGHLFFTTSGSVHHFKAIGEFKLELQSGNAQFGQSQQFFVPCDLEIWSMALKTIGHLYCPTSSFERHFIAICNFKRELHSRNVQFGSKSTIFLAVWPWNLAVYHEKQHGTSPNPHRALCII